MRVSRRRAAVSFTLTREGARLLLPYMKRQVVELDADDMRLLLRSPTAPTPLTAFSPAGQAAVRGTALGPCVAVCGTPAGGRVVCPCRRVAEGDGDRDGAVADGGLRPCFEKPRGLEHLPSAIAEAWAAQLG